MKRKIIVTIAFLFVSMQAAYLFAAPAGPVMSSDDALKLLQEGNARFVSMKMEHPDITAARREETGRNGQAPFAVVLACSDSRVPVETIFDRGIGDIFVVRVAGNVAMDASVIGSVQYAVEHLGCPLLVVFGHTECGAVAAAVSSSPLEGPLGEIQKKIEPIALKVEKAHSELKGSALTNAVVRANAIHASRDLFEGIPQISSLAGSGKLKVKVAIYDIVTGKVEWIELSGKQKGKNFSGSYFPREAPRGVPTWAGANTDDPPRDDEGLQPSYERTDEPSFGHNRRHE